jgi:hypothetical protein
VDQSFEFPDIEDLLTEYLGAALGVPAGTRSSTEAKYLRILRTGGPAPTRVTDSPQVTVEAYDTFESGALRLLGWARRALADLPGTELAGWSVKSVTEMGGPANLPDPNSTSKRYTMTAVVQIRGKQPI